jgi:hypothetical protein
VSGPLVEGNEATVVARCNGQQVSVADLSVAEEVWPVQKIACREADVIGPEAVSGVLLCFANPQGHLLRGLGVGVRRLRHDPHHAVFRDRAGCPAVLYLPCQPIRSGWMQGVGGVEERDDDVDVQKRAHQMPSSSRNRPALALVTMRADGEAKGRKPPTPWGEGSPCGVAGCVSAARSRRETTRPAEVRSRCAISLAASRTSSSMSIVVLMDPDTGRTKPSH